MNNFLCPKFLLKYNGEIHKTWNLRYAECLWHYFTSSQKPWITFIPSSNISHIRSDFLKTHYEVLRVTFEEIENSWVSAHLQGTTLKSFTCHNLDIINWDMLINIHGILAAVKTWWRGQSLPDLLESNIEHARPD